MANSDELACVAGVVLLFIAGLALDTALHCERLQRDRFRFEQRARDRTEYQGTGRTASHNIKTYYDLLGVSRNANITDIKKAYQILALKYHPDVCHDTNAEDRFKGINEAYRILSDNNRRLQYDRTIMAG